MPTQKVGHSLAFRRKNQINELSTSTVNRTLPTHPYLCVGVCLLFVLALGLVFGFGQLVTVILVVWCISVPFWAVKAVGMLSLVLFWQRLALAARAE